MRIIADYVNTRVEGSFPANILRPVLSYWMDGRWFVKSYKQGHWDGRIALYKKVPHQKVWIFPTGFLTRVTAVLDDECYRYTLVDNRTYDPPDPIYELQNGKEVIHLDKGKYDFQAQALNLALLHGRGIIRIATGGGKTELGAGIIKSLGKRTIWFTHRKNLLRQTHKRLEARLGTSVGIYGEGESRPDFVTVVMIQTAHTNYRTKNHPDLTKLLSTCECVIWDEVHHLESDQWHDVSKSVPAPWRYGLSATPDFDGPGMILIGMAGDIIVDVSVQELVEREVLVPPRIWFMTVRTPRLPKKVPYQTAYAQAIVDNQERNDLAKQAAWVFKQEGKPLLTFVRHIRHGRLLADYFCYHGIRTEFLCGEHDSDTRESTLEKLWSRELDCVVGQVQCFGEGQDLPQLRAVINATGGRGSGNKSEGESGRLTIQILGRGLRCFPGKLYFDYVDFADFTHPSLKRASVARVGTLEAEGYGPYINYWDQYKMNPL